MGFQWGGPETRAGQPARLPEVVTEFTDAHLAHLIGFLNFIGLRVGLLFHFKHGTLRMKRVAGRGLV